MNSVKVGILGLGTVGCGTVNLLQKNHDEITRRAGRDITISKAAVQNTQKKRPINNENLMLTDDAQTVVSDDELNVIVETIGGVEEARHLILTAIANKKHVVTANKALIAEHGNEIFSEAHKQGVMVAFEAAVAGGIPIIKSVKEGLAGNRIQSVAGIINGTCNYILSQMQENRLEFAEALSQAQSLGYAEADPHFDVGGIDAAHKLTILSAIAFGIPLSFSHVHCEGIEHITLEDLQYAERFGYTIKHLGYAARSEQGVELRVHPTLIPQKQILANVNDVMNAVLVNSDAGPTLFYGAGAGALPTASAVMADIVEVVRTLTIDPGNRVPHLAFQADAIQSEQLIDIGDIETAYYLRLEVKDEPGALANIAKIIGEKNISIEAMLQQEHQEPNGSVPIIFFTHKTREKKIQQAIQEITQLPCVSESVTKIRIESDLESNHA